MTRDKQTCPRQTQYIQQMKTVLGATAEATEEFIQTEFALTSSKVRLEDTMWPLSLVTYLLVKVICSLACAIEHHYTFTSDHSWRERDAQLKLKVG